MNKKKNNNNNNNIGPHVKSFNPLRPPQWRRRYQPRPTTNSEDPASTKNEAPRNKFRTHRYKWIRDFKEKLHPNADLKKLCWRLISKRKISIEICVELIGKLLGELGTTEKDDTTTIIKKDDTNTTTIIKKDDITTTTIIKKDDTNTTTIIKKDDTNTNTIIKKDDTTTTTDTDEMKRFVFWIETCIRRIPGQTKMLLIERFRFIITNIEANIQRKFLDVVKNDGKFDYFRKLGLLGEVERDEKDTLEEKEHLLPFTYRFAFFFDDGGRYLSTNFLMPDDNRLMIFTYESITPGKDVNIAIEEAIHSTQKIVVIMTETYINSAECYRIFSLLMEIKKKNVIIVVDKRMLIPPEWRECAVAIFNLGELDPSKLSRYHRTLFARAVRTVNPAAKS